MLANALLGLLRRRAHAGTKRCFGATSKQMKATRSRSDVDLKKFDIPTLFIHGDEDQNRANRDSALLASKIVKGAKLKVTRAHRTDCAPPTKNLVNEDFARVHQRVRRPAKETAFWVRQRSWRSRLTARSATHIGYFMKHGQSYDSVLIETRFSP